MTSTSFARARSAEQRDVRRRAILAAAADMLGADGRVAALTLNELSRRAGLAKSNVLRYFETREAVLLELLAVEYDAWLDDLEAELAKAGAAPAVEQVAAGLAKTVAARPVLADLLANATAVLEQNVSAQVAAAYKRRALGQTARLATIVESRVGSLTQDSQITLGGAVNLIVGGAWTACRPSPAMASAYELEPELAAFRLDYQASVRELMATILTGLLVRPASLSPEGEVLPPMEE